MKKAVRKLVEHAETPVDEQNNPSNEKQSSKMSNIARVFDSSPINAMTSKIKLVIVFIGKLLNTFFISITIKLIFVFVFLVPYYG